MTMPFGRHTGHDLKELSDRYLNWLADLELRPPLSDGVRRERERRKTGIEPPERLVSFPAVHVKIPSGERSLALRMVRLGHRVLAKKVDPEIRQRLDELAATVTEQLQAVRQ
jgi:hypothetical protein